ncbi:unnamed protein product [Lymnaea stagnalis]|uniref:Uncharacterized protein n=1 Tax=Lymnaea stagnalis TaxID=6523 RepID=A0AAV2IFV1_LYMST
MSVWCCWRCLPSTKDLEQENQFSRIKISDLTEVLCDNAWNEFLGGATMLQKLCRNRKNYDIEVPENFYVFEHIKTSVYDINFKEQDTDEAIQGERTHELSSEETVSRGVSCSDQVSLETFFGNDTPDRQTYKFRIEKSRKTVISVSFQRGFTFGGQANFSIGLAKDTSLGIETDLHFEVTKTDGQTFEETILTEATSDIVVGPHSHCTASICLEEKAFYKKFKVITRMSMPQEAAPVYIRRKSDKKVVMTSIICDLPQEFGGKVPCMKEVTEDGQTLQSKVDFITWGILKGTLVCNHKILLKSGTSVS